MNETLSPLMTQEEIGSIVSRLAGRIRRDYEGMTPVLVAVLKGAFVFTADLARALDMDIEIDFIQPSSYNDGSAPSAEVALLKRPAGLIKGRHVIVVEGIVDRGVTLKRVMEDLSALGPASIRVCSLLVREGLHHGASIDYIGRTVPQGFVVGYGMDLDERFRHLRGIYTLKERG